LSQQATALRLQQEKEARTKEVDTARWRLDHGDAPCEEAVKEWVRSQRKKVQKAEETAKRLENELPADDVSSPLKTTAEPRPTAYIPIDHFLPRPYGTLAPFKPSEPGANMRHFRQPEPKAIEL
jgi:hypothetical protein